MPISFWIRRFFAVFAIAFYVIAISRLLLRDASLAVALQDGLIWAPITSAVFTVGRYLQARRGQACAVCQDTPEYHADPPR